MIRVPPHSESAERGVLGSVLLEPDRIYELELKPDDFYDRRHNVLWEQLKEMSGSGKGMDALTIGEFLKANGTIERTGGWDYLAELQDAALVPHHSQHYAEIVKAKSDSRKMLDMLLKASESAYEGDALEVGSNVISEASMLLSAPELALTMPEYAQEYLNECEEGKAGTFNWWCPEWDDKLGKLSDELIILHAPRSTGKTALMLQWMVEAHRGGHRTPVASIEMLKKKLATRLIAYIGKVNTLLMRIRKPTEHEKERASEAIEKIGKLELCVRDKAMSIDDIRAFAILEDRRGCDALFVDNLLSINDGGKQFQSKTIMYDHFLRRFRDLRDTIGSPIIIVAHPNAEGKVAWSTDVENFADIIVFVMNVPTDGMVVNGVHVSQRADLIGNHVVARFQKNRDGVCLAASLEFVGETQSFTHLNWI